MRANLRTMSARPLASIVLVTWGESAVTERCLESLRATLGPELERGTFEIVVADNASPDDTLEMLARWAPLVRVVALPENRNFSGGCNAGAEAANGEVIVFLNNDTVVAPDTLVPLVEQALEPGVGAAGLRLVYPDGALQHGPIAMVGDAGGVAPYHLFHHQDGELAAARATYDVDVVTGACLAVRADVFREVGGFDEGYRNGFEDVDLCLRVRVAGHGIVYRGDLAFVHDEGVTRGATNGEDANTERFLATWGEMLDADAAMAARAWDGDLVFRRPDRDLPPSPLVVHGVPSAWGPAGAESRALLHAFEAGGHPAVAFEPRLRWVRPRVQGAVADALDRGLRRALPQEAIVVDVPDGPAMAAQTKAPTWMRVPRTSPVDTDALLLPAVPPAAGGPWAPPAILAPATPGGGGRGVLVALPAHDLPRTDALLAALADAPVPITLVASVRGRGLEARVAAALPGAALLGPFGDEQHWIALAATHDVAVCLDPDDPFERAALGAAAAGATPIVPDADGPAGAVLGELVAVASPETLAATLPVVLGAASGRRAALGRCVRTRCAPEVVGREILEILAAHVGAQAA